MAIDETAPAKLITYVAVRDGSFFSTKDLYSMKLSSFTGNQGLAYDPTIVFRPDHADAAKVLTYALQQGTYLTRAFPLTLSTVRTRLQRPLTTVSTPTLDGIFQFTTFLSAQAFLDGILKEHPAYSTAGLEAELAFSDPLSAMSRFDKKGPREDDDFYKRDPFMKPLQLKPFRVDQERDPFRLESLRRHSPEKDPFMRYLDREHRLSPLKDPEDYLAQLREPIHPKGYYNPKIDPDDYNPKIDPDFFTQCTDDLHRRALERGNPTLRKQPPIRREGSESNIILDHFTKKPKDPFRR